MARPAKMKWATMRFDKPSPNSKLIPIYGLADEGKIALAWKLTPEEIEVVKEYGIIGLIFYGDAPPHSVFVLDEEEDSE